VIVTEEECPLTAEDFWVRLRPYSVTRDSAEKLELRPAEKDSEVENEHLQVA